MVRPLVGHLRGARLLAQLRAQLRARRRGAAAEAARDEAVARLPLQPARCRGLRMVILTLAAFGTSRSGREQRESRGRIRMRRHPRLAAGALGGAEHLGVAGRLAVRLLVQRLLVQRLEVPRVAGEAALRIRLSIHPMDEFLINRRREPSRKTSW